MMSLAVSFRPHLTRALLLRAVAAGSAWGVLLTAGFATGALWNCGIICLDDVAITAGTSIAAGILTIGPLTLLRKVT